MARIADREPKDASGGYERLFGVAALGTLISKVQGAVISAGSELEKLIAERVQPIADLNEFLDSEIMPEGVFIATKRQVDEIRAALKDLMKIGNGRNFV